MKTPLRIFPRLAVLAVSVAAAAGGLHAAGTTAADFLNIAVGARPAGLGEAFVAVADETSGMLYNPAGLAFSLSPELQTMYSLWPGDIYYGYMGYAQPTFTGTYGLAFQYLSSPATPKIVDGTAAGDFNFYDAAANLLYATRLSETAAAGIVLRGIQSRLDGPAAAAVTGDAGILFRTLEEGFSLGIAGQNLGGTLGGDPLPATYRAGMAFKADLPEQYSDILFSIEAGQTQGQPAYYAAGLEHWGAGTLGLRVGYKYIADDRQRESLDALAPWRAGFSLRVQSLALDYAYQPFASLGEAHRLTLTWRTFGWKMRWRTVPCEVKADPAIFSPNNDGSKDSIFFVPRVTQIKDVKTWTLTLSDADRRPVHTITGRDVVPRIISWEGQTAAGGLVPEGVYTYALTVEGDGHKRAVSNTGTVTADLTPPAASLQLSETEISPNGDALADGATFYVSVSDGHGIDQWQVSVINDRHKTVKVFKSTESAPVDLVWDGTDDYYGLPVPNGVYGVQLTAWDTAGNRAKADADITVNVPPRVEVREVVREVIREIEVKEEKRGLVVNLSSQVLFPIGKTVLRPEAHVTLDELVNLLQTYPDNDVLIEGYTDSSGSSRRNLEISSARAWTVYSYLVNHGIAPARLKPTGYGAAKPVASNATMGGRAQNRRVEIIILKQQ
jgi:outer membrane protein OmpA-like peptidoglycan-associated protein